MDTDDIFGAVLATLFVASLLGLITCLVLFGGMR